VSARSNAVLVVEDNPDNLYLATVLLQNEGYRVVGASTGADGLAAVQREAFDFVLLDLQLPDWDGFEVAEKIRCHASAATLPIIAASAFAMPSDRRKAFAAGCTGYLEKPIDADTFVAQVRCLAQQPAEWK